MMFREILLLLLSSFALEALRIDNNCTNLNSFVLIRNQISGLMLDARNGDYVTIEPFDRSAVQEWIFKISGRVAAFNIINRSAGLALDVNPEPNSDNTHNLTLGALGDSPSQRWIINFDGTIVNAGFGDGSYSWAVNIPYSNYEPGNGIVVYPLVGELTDNERFSLEYEIKKYE